MLVRSIRYKAYPNERQIEQIKKILWSCRYTWNKLLESAKCNEYKNIKKEEIDKIINSDKMKGTDFFAIRRKCLYLNQTLEKYRKGKIKRIKFKSAINQNKSLTYTTTATYIKNKGFMLPIIGLLKVDLSIEIPFDVKIYEVTIFVYADGEYYLSVSYNADRLKENPTLNLDKSVGLDFSIKHIYVDSFGDRACEKLPWSEARTKYYASIKTLEGMIYDSKEYNEQVRRISYYQRRFDNVRTEYFKLLTSKLIRDYDYIFIEDIKLPNMESDGFEYARYTNWYQFTTILTQRAELKGKRVVKVNHFFPSSQLCSVCGYLYERLTPEIRQWECPSCGTTHDRDKNAAINILNEGKRMIRHGCTK